MDLFQVLSQSSEAHGQGQDLEGSIDLPKRRLVTFKLQGLNVRGQSSFSVEYCLQRANQCALAHSVFHGQKSSQKIALVVS